MTRTKVPEASSLQTPSIPPTKSTNSLLIPPPGRRGTRRRPGSVWERRLQELLSFRKAQGHLNVPRHWPENPRLANWVNNQRRLIQDELISPARLRRLESLGISWEGSADRRRSQEEAWERLYGALRAYRRTFGNLEVPRGWTVEPRLAAWLATQRHEWRTGTLSGPREARLRELDPEWHRARIRERATEKPPSRPRRRRDDAWERRVLDLKRYHEAQGHCAIPARWSEDPGLALWVVRQRVLRKRGALSGERVDRLDALGFLWSGDLRKRSLEERRWSERCDQLSRYVAAHDHCSVALEDRAWPGLAAWIFRQRNAYRRGTLSDDRVRVLETLKFVWNPRDPGRSRSRHWERMFEALLRFRRTQAPAKNAEGGDSELRQWLSGQRRRQRAGKLSRDLALRLEQAGVCWNELDRRWEARYGELLDYRQRQGDCNVDMTGTQDRRLARWVSAQRTARKAGRLSDARISRLEAVGFLWSAAPRSR